MMSRISHAIKPLVFATDQLEGAEVGSISIDFEARADHANISDSDLKGIGTKGIARSAPNNPSAGLAQFLGEAREGLPRVLGSGLLKEKSNFLKGSSNEYLNVEFGWKPMVSDLRKFAHSVRNHDQIIHGFVKGSDKKIRRRYQYPTIQEFDEKTGRVPLYHANAFGEGFGFSSFTNESWFAGAFRYHVPVGDDTMSKLQRYKSEAGKLLGARLTPDLVWELAPWSWAADWFANTGEIMTNISNLGSDGLVLQYGYAMNHRETVNSLTTKLNGQTGTYERTQTTKRRIPASPYGFDLQFDGFSARQTAIVAALGLSRGR